MATPAVGAAAFIAVAATEATAPVIGAGDAVEVAGVALPGSAAGATATVTGATAFATADTADPIPPDPEAGADVDEGLAGGGVPGDDGPLAEGALPTAGAAG